LSGFLGSVFGEASLIAGYLLKKGENLAMHQDIRKLVDQVRAVTKVEGIQTKLSEEV
jgi:hypothetical protein